MIQNVENPPFESIMAAKISIIQQTHNLVFPIWLVSKMADCQKFLKHMKLINLLLLVNDQSYNFWT